MLTAKHDGVSKCNVWVKFKRLWWALYQLKNTFKGLRPDEGGSIFQWSEIFNICFHFKWFFFTKSNQSENSLVAWPDLLTPAWASTPSGPRTEVSTAAGSTSGRLPQRTPKLTSNLSVSLCLHVTSKQSFGMLALIYLTSTSYLKILLHLLKIITNTNYISTFSNLHWIRSAFHIS